MRVVVSGSRDWTDREAIYGALDKLAGVARYSAERIAVVHGCAKGADVLADEWCRERRAADWPVDVERFPADWSNGKGAGPRRNRVMLRPGADAVLVFLLPCSQKGCKRTDVHGSHGATDCGEHAESLGIPTVWCDPKGVRDAA
jgi:hypothetical protein